HIIGLGHIGTLLKTPLCQRALLAAELGTDGEDNNTRGGKDSLYCYGIGEGIAIVGNIMGAGEDFTVANASPWVWAMAFIRQRPDEIWKAVRIDPGPWTWVKTS